uniref:S1-like domain-containing protein n=1 Tax=Ditylenchus dipsaci TaxID=166011 RepID=A0A915EDK8_9BILA
MWTASFICTLTRTLSQTLATSWMPSTTTRKNEKDELKRELIEKTATSSLRSSAEDARQRKIDSLLFRRKSSDVPDSCKLRKKMWIGTGDIVLIGLRDYQDDKADVILKYTPDEARVLKAQGHLPDSARLNELGDEPNEGDVEFVDAAEDGLEDDVAAQDREYQLFSSSSEESDSYEESDVESEEEEAGQEVESKKPSKQQSSSDDESEEDEDNSELLAQRGERMKPGARDKMDRRGKGKRGK